MSKMTKEQARRRRHAPGPREGARNDRASPSGRLPLQPHHLRPGDRRCQRHHARAADSRTTAGDGDKSAQAKAVGKLIAERAKAAGIETVVFDRGGFLYHGRVKALAEGAREGGLNF